MLLKFRAHEQALGRGQQACSAKITRMHTHAQPYIWQAKHTMQHQQKVGYGRSEQGGHADDACT